MKRVIREAAVGLGLCALALSADAAGPADRGRELFESTQLGTSGTSCISCHPGGKKLEWAGSSYDDAKLAAIVNRCIEKALKGKPLDPGGEDMKALMQHIRSFGNPGG